MENGKVLDSTMEVDLCHQLHGVLPLKVFLQKRLTCPMGDSNKFSMYRSWLKCNFTAMHEVTSELIHPSELDFSSLCVSLLPFRSGCAVSPQGQTPLNSGPKGAPMVRQSRLKFPSSPGALGGWKYFFRVVKTPPWHAQTGRQNLQPVTERQREHFGYSWISAVKK